MKAKDKRKRINPSQPNGEYMPEGTKVVMYSEETGDMVIDFRYSSLPKPSLLNGEVSHWRELPQKTNNMMRLFSSFYLEKNEARRSELIECLQRNASNELIDEIIVIYEHEPLKSADANCNIPLYSPDKVSYKLQVGRPTFKQLFDKANELIESDNDVSIISNSDIFFDGTLQLAIDNIKNNECYALSRWERNEDGSEGTLIQRFGDSMDCWLFKGKIDTSIFSDFHLAKMGSDNRICYEIKKAGYFISNPSFSIKTWHVHHSGVRNYNPLIRNKDTVIAPPYHIVPPSELNLEATKA